MITAKWREGFGGLFKTADAQKCAEEIRAIGDAPTTQQIVDAARDENTELHKCFEWDDSLAAEKWRLKQARDVVHHLVIKEETVPEDRPEIRFFVKPKSDEGYKPVKLVVQNEDEYKALLEKAWAELHAFKVKYSILNELQEIFDLID